MHSTLLQDLALVLIVAGVVTVLFHRLKQPVVLGYILAGIIVGPHTPPYPLVHDTETINVLAELGVILLMFGLGLHFSLKKLASVGVTAFIAAFLEILLMLLLGFGLGRAFGWSPMNSLFLGAILSISSTTIIVKALGELGRSKEHFAELIFGILVVEDILAIAMIALLSSVARTGTVASGEVLITLGKLALFLVVTLIAGLLLVPRFLRYISKFKSNEMLLVATLGLCFGVSLIALKMGYSVALGAFLIGAIIAEARDHGKIETLVDPVKDMFSAVFFVTIGMMIDPRVLAQYWLPILIISAVVIVGKILACGFGTFVAGHSLKTSLRVGMGVAQIGEFSFIIAQLGLTTKTTDAFLYPIAIAVSAITTLTTPYLIKSSDTFAAAIDNHAPTWITRYLTLYTEWTAQLGKGSRGNPLLRKLMRRWAIQLAINIMLMTALLIAANWAVTHVSLESLHLPDWLLGGGGGGAKEGRGGRAILWLAAMILALPILIAIVRKVRAISMVLAEIAVTSAKAGKHVKEIRAAFSAAIFGVGLGASLLWVLFLSIALSPPWPIIIALLAAILIFGGFLWQRAIRIYAQAQATLEETLADRPREPHAIAHEETPRALPPALAGAQLLTIEVLPTSPAANRLIRELNLRHNTGASIVAIDRPTNSALPSTSLINPGPDEELLPGDHVLLLGTQTQLQNAATHLHATQNPPSDHAFTQIS